MVNAISKLHRKKELQKLSKEQILRLNDTNMPRKEYYLTCLYSVIIRDLFDKYKVIIVKGFYANTYLWNLKMRLTVTQKIIADYVILCGNIFVLLLPESYHKIYEI